MLYYLKNINRKEVKIMTKHLLYGASIGMVVGVGSGYFNGAAHGLIIGLTLFIFATAIRLIFQPKAQPTIKYLPCNPPNPQRFGGFLLFAHSQAIRYSLILPIIFLLIKPNQLLNFRDNLRRTDSDFQFFLYCLQIHRPFQHRFFNIFVGDI